MDQDLKLNFTSFYSMTLQKLRLLSTKNLTLFRTTFHRLFCQDYYLRMDKASYHFYSYFIIEAITESFYHVLLPLYGGKKTDPMLKLP